MRDSQALHLVDVRVNGAVGLKFTPGRSRFFNEGFLGLVQGDSIILWHPSATPSPAVQIIWNLTCK